MSSTVARLRTLILICGIILVVLIGTAGAIQVTMSPEFCSKCHVMAPEYATWKASSHLEIACVECHIKPGLKNLILHKISAIKEVYLYVTGTYEQPIKMSHKLEDEICRQCHSSNRAITPSGDLIVPHDKHAAQKVMCVECHSGVAHGNIAARKVTQDGNYQVWTPEYGLKQMSKEYAEPKMNVCLDCHIQRGITRACEACHTSISIPPDHKVKGWGTTHGLVAKSDLGYCNKCHSYSLEAKDVPVEGNVARYARGNVFCYECHQRRPSGHNAEWKMVHKRNVKNRDVSGCVVCHDVAKSKPENRAVPTYCAKCHGNQIGNADTSLTSMAGKRTFSNLHPPNWRKIHPSIVKEKGATNEGCWNCHDTAHCSRCHMNRL